MLIRLDKLICRYAKFILRIAGFFGLDRYRLVFLWIAIASAVSAIPLFKTIAEVHFLVMFLITFAVFRQMAIHQIYIMQYIKHLTKLIGDSPPQEIGDRVRNCRVISFFMLVAVSFIFVGREASLLWPVLVPFKLLLPLHLWIYFLDDDQNTRRKSV